jgi:hypothetical protein
MEEITIRRKEEGKARKRLTKLLFEYGGVI